MKTEKIMNELNEGGARVTWSENVIIADADYIDRVAFNLIVNFERMLGRRIPPADMARWVECVALDGGVRENTVSQQTTVVLVHEKSHRQMRNFAPADYQQELNGQAFSGNLGEFILHAIPVEELVSKTDLLVDVATLMIGRPEVKRMVIIPNAEEGDSYERVRRLLKQADADKTVTLLAMQPMPGGNFRQEILGYSLMQAMGIRGEELSAQGKACSNSEES